MCLVLVLVICHIFVQFIRLSPWVILVRDFFFHILCPIVVQFWWICFVYMGIKKLLDCLVWNRLFQDMKFVAYYYFALRWLELFSSAWVFNFYCQFNNVYSHAHCCYGKLCHSWNIFSDLSFVCSQIWSWVICVWLSTC